MGNAKPGVTNAEDVERQRALREGQGDTALADDIRRVINAASRENKSNTPDYILACFMLDSLKAFEVAIKDRDKWFGRVSPAVQLVAFGETDQENEGMTC